MTRNPSAAALPSSAAEEPAPGGNGLLWVLVAVAIGFAVLAARARRWSYAALVDWQTVGALAGLLAITQGVEKSGMLQATAQRLLGAHAPTCAAWRCCSPPRPPLLSALVTNDVSLFLLVPLTRVLATQAHLPLARLVVLQALAVNAGSALTPIGNPQNLYLWHRSGESFVGFMWMMAPTVASCCSGCSSRCGCWCRATPHRRCSRSRRRPGGAAAAVLAGAAVRGLRGRARPALAAAPGWRWCSARSCCFYPRVLRGVDWALLAIIALMFVDLRQLARAAGRSPR